MSDAITDSIYVQSMSRLMWVDMGRYPETVMPEHSHCIGAETHDGSLYITFVPCRVPYADDRDDSASEADWHYAFTSWYWGHHETKPHVLAVRMDIQEAFDICDAYDAHLQHLKFGPRNGTDPITQCTIPGVDGQNASRTKRTCLAYEQYLRNRGMLSVAQRPHSHNRVTFNDTATVRRRPSGSWVIPFPGRTSTRATPEPELV